MTVVGGAPARSVISNPVYWSGCRAFWATQILSLIVLCVLGHAKLCSPAHAAAGGPSISEFAAKASFLYNLTKFVEWPADTVASSLPVCIVAGTPIDKAAIGAFTGKTAGGHPVELRFISRPAEAGSCRVVYIGGSDPRQIGPILKAADAGATLIVGDSTALLEMKGMVSIVLRLAKEWRPR